MKNILLVIVTILVGWSMCSCGVTSEKEKTETVQNGKNDNIFPTEYKYESKELTIDIEHIHPNNAKFNNGISHMADLDYVKIGRMIMPDDGTNTINTEEECILSNKMTDDAYDQIYSWGIDACSYDTVKSSILNACVRDDKKYDDFNLDKYTVEKVFSFGNVEQARQDIVNSFANCGIDLSTDFSYEVYYLDHVTLQSEEEHIDIDGNIQADQYKKDWSDQDDTYLFYFHKIYCGLRDFQKNVYADETAEDRNAQLTVMYNKDGIISFNLQNLYLYENSGEPVALMEFDDIMNVVKNYYENIVDGVEKKVISAELIVDSEKSSKDAKKLIPVWAFGIEETPEGESTSRYELRVNAETGAIIIQ